MTILMELAIDFGMKTERRLNAIDLLLAVKLLMITLASTVSKPGFRFAIHLIITLAVQCFCRGLASLLAM